MADLGDRVKHTVSKDITGTVIAKYMDSKMERRRGMLVEVSVPMLDVRLEDDRIRYGTPEKYWRVVAKYNEEQED